MRERGRDTLRTLPDTMEFMHPADGVTSTAKFARECLVSDLLAFQASVPSGLMARSSAAAPVIGRQLMRMRSALQGILEVQRNLNHIDDPETFREQQEAMLIFCNRFAEVCASLARY